MKILGVRFGHDAAAALVVNGEIIADAGEERFTRVKNDTSFPINAISYCLEAGGISSEDLDCLAIPGTGIPDEFFIFFSIPDSIIPVDLVRDNKGVKDIIRSVLNVRTQRKLPVLPLYQKPFKLSSKCRIHLSGHHLAHAASACYTSGYNEEKALCVTMDGRGDAISVALWRFEANRIESIKWFEGNASLGWFYSNATEAMGWRHGSDEWKVMGLAPYGNQRPGALKGFYPEFKDGDLVRPHEFGEFGRWNDHGANHYHGKDSENLSRIVGELGMEDFAAEVQKIFEEQAFNVILPWLEKENTRILCTSGGCFLNVKFNQKLWYTGKVDDLWIYPNPGDAGIAAGAALHAFYMEGRGVKHKKLDNLYFGPEFSNEYIEGVLKDRGIDYKFIENPSEVCAQYLYRNLVVGWFQGRMEAGPRALGNRSILMSSLKAENKDIINAKVKYRETFRPFCPSMLYEKRNDYLVKPRDEFFMICSFDVTQDKKDKIPAVVHVDGTARPQMVMERVNPLYYEVIKAFGDLTGEYVILNTSFNIKGEPIVCHPREAIKCFYDTGIDVLIMGNFVVEKPALKENKAQ